MKHYLLILLIIASSGCSKLKRDYILFNQSPALKKSSPVIQKETITKLNTAQFEYKIQPHDRVSVIVYKHPELSTSNSASFQQERGILVNSRGDIRLPLIKRVHIAGLSQTEAENRLTEAFALYIKEPNVQLEVLNKKAYIVGEVRKPGEIELPNEQLSLMQIIAKAGDFTDQADRRSIMILRSKNGSKVATEIVNLTDINSLRTANLMIKPNDIVYVLPNNMKAFNVKVNEVSPLFNLISNALSPFVTLKVLTGL